MYRLLFTLAILFLALTQGRSQILFTENFTTSNWTINVVNGTEGTDPNLFVVADYEGGVLPPGCGVTGNGNNTLHISSSFNPIGGAAYDAGGLCGIWTCPMTNRSAYSPTINGSGSSALQVSFDYLEGGQGTLDNATLWYYDGSSWSQIDDMPKTVLCASGQGQWASRTVNLPLSATNNPSIKIGFKWENNDDGLGSDPSFAVDNVVVSGTPSSANTIITNPINNTSLCACATGIVSFVSSGTFTAGNMYTVQLSNASGSFASPISIGSISSTANSGAISVTYPCSTPNGSGYRVRVVSSLPVILGSNNGSNLSINPVSVPTITINSVAAGNMCLGTPVTFIATITNGGASPVYQWKLNGNNVGANASTFVSNTLVSGDVVTCTLTSNAPCVNPTVVPSNPITMSFFPPPSLSILANPSTTICAGNSVTLTATGAASYAWSGGVQNGVSFTPTATTTYTVTGTSVNGCTGTSVITLNLIPNATPSLSLVSSPNPVVTGQSATFTANVGSATAYQIKWYKGNVLTSTTTNPNNTFTTMMSSLADSVYAVLIPTGCYDPDSVKSSVIRVQYPQATSSVLQKGFLIYPNPSNGQLTIQDARDIKEVIITNAMGQTVYSSKFIYNDQIHIQPLTCVAGLYTLHIKTSDHSFFQQVIVE